MKFLTNSTNKQLLNDISESLNPLFEYYDYTNVLLIDVNGDVRLAWPDQDTLIGDHLRPLLEEVILSPRVVLTDLHRASEISSVHLDLIVPMIDNSQENSMVFGLLVIRVDPHKFLYPLIKSWPTPSKTAETLLLRRDGDEIVFLNELRHMANTELILKMPLSSSNLPAAMAVQGILGTVNGLDYRNVPVVAAMKKIPGLPWYMVAKVDREEVFLTLSKQMRMVIITLTLFLISIGLILWFLWWNQRVRFYRDKYEAQR